ncbi:MAG: hypothetical protein ACKO35_13400, partial [Planctomycetaceae bacterium]
MADDRLADDADPEGIGTRSDRDVSTVHSSDTAPAEVGLPRAATNFGLDRPEPEVDPLIGREFGDVQLVRLVGQGGMGR